MTLHDSAHERPLNQMLWVSGIWIGQPSWSVGACLVEDIHLSTVKITLIHHILQSKRVHLSKEVLNSWCNKHRWRMFYHTSYINQSIIIFKALFMQMYQKVLWWLRTQSVEEFRIHYSFLAFSNKCLSPTPMHCTTSMYDGTLKWK